MTLVDEESGLKESEPERKRKKIEDSSLGKSVAPDVPEGEVKMTLFPYTYKLKFSTKISVLLLR